MDVFGITSNLELGADDIYVARSASETFYPEEGSSYCLEVERDSFWFNHRNDVIASNVLKHSPGRRFFDVGGGNGFVAKRLQDEGVEVVLVEPSLDGARNAKARGVEKVICATLGDAGFAPGQFGSAGFFDVLEHIDDDVAFLRDVHTHLTEGALLYLTVPAFSFLWSQEDDNAEHRRRYRLPELRTRLETCGFRVVYATYIFSVLPLPVFVFRSVPSRIGTRRDHNELSKYKKEHKSDKGLMTRALNGALSLELARVRAGKTIPFGGSCFVVAEKLS